MTGTGLDRLDAGADGRVAAAILSTGETLAIDLALIGIGGVARDGLARAAGLACDNGILVDTRGRTEDPHIFACGDVARFRLGGGLVRLESVQNALDQAHAVAAELAGQGQDYAPVPWFWSEQYDTKLQSAGLNTGFDATVSRPGKRQTAFSVWYYRHGKLIAVDAVDDPQAYMAGRRLLTAGLSPPPATLADPSVALKSLL